MDKRAGGEYQDFPSKIFCLTVPKISVGECFIVALISGTEKVSRRGGVSRFSVENFLSHSADENFRRRIFYRCINFGYRKSLEKRGGGEGEYRDFPSKIFCLTLPTKISVGESFTVALISVSEKNWIGGWEYQDFPLKILSHSAEKFRSGIFHCCINFGYRKRLEKRGRGVPRFRSKNLSHSAENFRRGILYCCIIFW